MPTNLLKALITLIKVAPSPNLVETYSSTNRINNVGDGLEFYVKDLFSNSFEIEDYNKKLMNYSRYFSYTGNKNNPPDLMIIGGDAIEVKKQENGTSDIALNSSHPKDKLYCSDPRVSQACRDAEEWTEKDMIYVVGHVESTIIKKLFFVEGNLYCADTKTYDRISDAIKEGVSLIPDIEFAETKELGRVNCVDPLGITNLRIRGMWTIQNPNRVFSYIYPTHSDSRFSAVALISLDKYNSYPEEDREMLESLVNEGFSITDVEVKDPNNPVKLIKSKLLKVEVS